MEQLFDIESGIKEEFSYAGGRRKECKAKGLKPNSKEFKSCLKDTRDSDKELGKEDRRKIKKERKADYDQAIVEGKVKKSGFGKVVGVLKKTNPLFILMRSSSLSLIRLNLWGMATKMAILKDKSSKDAKAKKGWIQLMAHWIKFGGDKEKLIKGIEAGKGKKQLLTRKKKKVENTYKKKKRTNNFDGENGEFFDNEFRQEFSNVAGVDDAAILTWITTGATVLSTMVAILRKNKETVGEMPISESDANLLDKNPAQTELSEQDIANGAEAVGEEQANSKSKKTTIAVVIGSVVLLGIALLLIKQK